MKKKIISTLLTLTILSTTAAACGNNSVTTASQPEQKEEATDTTAKEEANSRKEPEIEWTELASLNTVPEIREAWDTAAGIQKTDKGKEGMFYTNSKGENDNNNTLMQAMKTSTDVPMSPMSTLSMYTNIDDTAEPSVAFREPFVKAVLDQYTDIDEADEGKAFLAGLNSYYNLLPNTNKDTSESNIDTSLTRKEFMAMVYRADTPVQKISQDKEFTKAVGKSVYNDYAQNLKNNSYLTIESGDLNPTTYDGSISKAEAIYILINRYYRDELVETSSKEDNMSYMYTTQGDKVEITFTDTKLNMDLKDKGKLESLNEALKDADVGLSPELYGSLVIAVKHNIINPEEDTCWDETVSTAEAMQLLINTYSTMSKDIVEAGANTEVFMTKEEQAEAEVAQAREDYAQQRANGKVDGDTKNTILASMPKEECGDRQGLSGYNLKIDSQGLHYLVSVIDGHEVHIGEKTDMGETYMGEINSCKEDAIHWYRLTHPNTEKTDDEIIARFGLD